MPRVFKRGLILVVALIAFILVLRASRSDRWRVEDASYHFTFWHVTHGTNHTVSSGLSAFGWINRNLIKSGHRRVSRAQLYSWRTDQEATCLAVGFKHDGEILKLDPVNGFSYPVEYSHLEGVIVDAAGHTNWLQTPKGFSGTIYIPQTKEYMHCWKVPDHITNFHGCEVRLSRDGKDVATLRIR